MEVKTTFVGKRNPFTGNTLKGHEPAAMYIDNQPMPKGKVVTSKYEPLFMKLKVGQCIVVDKDKTDAVGQALRGYLKKYNLRGKVKCFSSGFLDGKGRVYRMENTK